MDRPSARLPHATRRTVSPAYFREQYARTLDPWNYAKSAYEASKYRATLGALPRARYGRALEAACSIGVFTGMLAERCDQIVAFDASPIALAEARRRVLPQHPHVRFACVTLPDEFVAGSYDLIAFCEVGYYLAPADLSVVRERIAGAAARGGQLVLVHWTPYVPGHAMTADEVHAAFVDDARWRVIRQAREQTYRLDVLERC